MSVLKDRLTITLEKPIMLYLDLFDKKYLERAPRTGVTQPRDLEYIKRLYTFNKDAIKEYYLSRNFAVKNTHILSRFLELISPHLNYDAYEYLEYIDSRISYLAKHFKFTSETERGILHPPYFFGNDGSEAILYGYEPIDAYRFIQSWKKQECVKVLTHPRNDSRLLLPLGKDDGNAGGFSCMLIDIRRLALMYREFVREQSNNSSNEEGMVLSKNHFVIKYILPSMMEDVIDHTLLNRVMSAFYEIPCTQPEKKYPFMTFVPETQVERYIEDTLDNITRKSMTFLEVLQHIKLIFREDASELLALPDMYSTRQLRPAVTATRVDYMLFVLRVAKTTRESRDVMNDWRRYAQRVLNDNGLANYFDYGTEQILKGKLEELIELTS